MEGTVQSRAVGDELKLAREAAHMSREQVKDALGLGAVSTVSRWENGVRGITEQNIVRYLQAVGASVQKIDEVMDMARNREASMWVSFRPVERARMMATLLRIEDTARRIVYLADAVVPGLLQTDAYVRAIMAFENVPEDEIRQRVAERLGRSRIIHRRDNPVALDAFIDEAVLWRPIDPSLPQQHLDQLRYLLECADLPNVRIRILPFSKGRSPLQLGGFVWIEPSEGGVAVHQELHRVAVFYNDPIDLAVFESAIERTGTIALSVDESKGLIAGIITKMERVDEKSAAAELAEVDLQSGSD
ncbi:helix-turn-helix transcriptional regulator [Amycolatopsis sp. NPDC021455]|uniref:helix-turn-helix domain-containing protein n=1 Tax=Amycolatopsis sp. NPDC021455 TaxID=3154901 RepID=UPI0033DA2914